MLKEAMEIVATLSKSFNLSEHEAALYEQLNLYITLHIGIANQMLVKEIREQQDGRRNHATEAG